VNKNRVRAGKRGIGVRRGGGFGGETLMGDRREQRIQKGGGGWAR